MSDHRMLGEDETLQILRAGWTGSEPAYADDTAVVMRTGQGIRRRRRALQGGAGLVLTIATVAAIGVGAPGLTADRTTVLQPAETPQAGPARIGYAQAGATDRRLLVEALGPDFRVALSRGAPGFEYIELVPGSPSAKSLPKGYEAEAVVNAAPDGDTASEACAPENLQPSAACETRTLPDGLQVTIVRASPTLEASAPVGLRNVYFEQPDGVTVHVALFVRPATVDTRTAKVPRTAINAWLQSFEAALITAATDPHMVAGSGDNPDDWTKPLPDTYGANQQVLLERLGRPFAAGPDNDRVIATLPSGFVVEGSLRSGVSKVELDRMCDTEVDEVGTVPCERRVLPDGRSVVVQTWTSASDALAYVGKTHVYFLRPDHIGVWVELAAREVGASTTADREAAMPALLRDLRALEDKLIAAVIDPRISSDGRPF